MPHLFDRHGPSSIRRGSLRLLAAVHVITALAALTAPAPHAAAAPGDAFDPDAPHLFLSEGTPTGLYELIAAPDGSMTLAAVGPPSAISYNSIGYDPTTNYLYGVVTTGDASFPSMSIIRIGQDGALTRVGTSVLPMGTSNMGVVKDGFLFAGQGNLTTMAKVDLSDGSFTTFTLADKTFVSDLTFSAGYFWGIDKDGAMVRFDLLAPTPSYIVVPAQFATGGYGAAWTYGNGNLGFVHTSGHVLQIAVTDPASSAPTFTTVATSTGPTTALQDSASSIGLPTNLAIGSSVDHATYRAGDELQYTLTVTNNGPGTSTGSVVTVAAPPGFSSVTAGTPGCSVSGTTATCTVGSLASGANATISLSGVTSPTATGPLAMATTVTANEVDSVTNDNASQAQSVPASATLGLVTTATSSGQGPAVPGAVVTYAFTISNTGNVTMTGVTAVVGSFSGSGPLTDVVCPAEAASVGPGQSVTCSASYTVVAADAARGELSIDATARGTAPDNSITSSPNSNSTMTTSQPTDTSTTAPSTTAAPVVTTVPPWGTGTLPATGPSIPSIEIVLASASMAIGGALMLLRRLRYPHDPDVP